MPGGSRKVEPDKPGEERNVEIEIFLPTRCLQEAPQARHEKLSPWKWGKPTQRPGDGIKLAKEPQSWRPSPRWLTRERFLNS